MRAVTPEETREQVRALYLRWPERRRWASARRGAYAFYRWLRSSGDPVVTMGSFGPGDAFLVIKRWCAEWESLWADRA